MVRALAILGAVALAPLGCGSGERTFDAGEFVEEANKNGAGLSLAEPLSTSDEDAELYSVSLEDTDKGADESAEAEEGHEDGGASLRVSPDAEAARREFERCEMAVSLVCYRASNVVLILESPEPAVSSRLERALRAMESD